MFIVCMFKFGSKYVRNMKYGRSSSNLSSKKIGLVHLGALLNVALSCEKKFVFVPEYFYNTPFWCVQLLEMNYGVAARCWIWKTEAEIAAKPRAVCQAFIQTDPYELGLCLYS